MRDLLMKHGVAHRWFDPAVPVDGPVAAHLLAERGLTQDQMPFAILGAAEVLVQPTPEQIAAGLGLDSLSDGTTADVLVVGSDRKTDVSGKLMLVHVVIASYRTIRPKITK